MAGARSSARRELVARLVPPRRNRRRGTRPGLAALRRALSVALPGSLVVGLALVAWPYARDAAIRHPYFAVREVVVRAHHRLPADEVRAAAGITPGTSIWEVDAAAAEARLAGHRWIRVARVRRELPHQVVIEVREERPLAIVVLEDGKGEYYVSPHGHLFAPVEANDARDFPYVTGLARADLKQGERLGPRALHRALALVRQSGGLTVSEVHVDRVRGLTLLPVRPSVPIELGWSGFAAKLARLPRVLALWAGRESEIVAVNLQFDDEVIVRTQPARAVALARGAA
ncbi:MAG TPA: FtsQ-type POTRA domain-containing protein [Candidatus Limnocylindria bacterium]|nr:FtsQ-type POTRA domain-containing protein [Candidatus Limnocylindria bacterium]